MKENVFYHIYANNKMINESNVTFENSNETFEIKGVNDYVERVLSLKQNESDDNKINIIASTILQKRNALKLTQEEVCKDICSISYISNLEANKYIKINNGFIYQICERLDINYNDLDSINPLLIINNTYKFYLNNQFSELDYIYNNLQNTIDVPCENLYRAFYSLIHNDLDNFKSIMNKIDDIKKTLNTDEVIFMLFIMILYFIKSMRFTKAYGYIVLINRFDLKNEYLRALVQEYNYIVSGHMCINTEKYEETKLKAFYDTVYPIPRQINILLQSMIFNPEGNVERLKNMNIDLFNNEIKEHYYYVLAYVYIMNKQYLEGIEIIIESKIESVKMLNILGLGIIMLKNDNTDVPIEVIKDYKHTFNRLCKKINTNPFDKLPLTFLELLKFELDGKDSKFICDFIKYRLLPVYEEMQYKPYKLYIDARYLYLLGKLARYKDGYNYCMENENRLKNYEFYYIINSIKE